MSSRRVAVYAGFRAYYHSLRTFTFYTMSSNAVDAGPGASAASFRQFPFFDAHDVKDVHDLAKPPEIFKSTPEISTISPSSLGLLVADIHGSVHVLNEEFTTVIVWIAHVNGRVMHMAERRGILITLGEEDNVRAPLLKVWDLHKRDKRTGFPALVRSTKVQLSNKPHPISTVALSESLSHLAIGMGDGTALLYKHLDQSIFSTSTSLTALPKPRIIHESPTEPITGLGFKELTMESPNLHLFIVTTNRVLGYQVSGSGSGTAPSVLDEVGCGLGCATMDGDHKNIIVARDEAIYVCGVDGRGPGYAYEGTKLSIHTHKTYLVMVSPPFFPSASAASTTVRNFVRNSGDQGDTDITKVTVFDPENKFVAYSGAFRESVRQVFSQWGHVYVLSNDGKLTCLKEKPTSEKLDMLYRKALYIQAINLAETQKLDDDSVADIHRQFGDHLYGKGDYDGAMQQYVQTIGHLQPSYVIRKFLDAQRIHNLVTYLQELHALGLANSDHTTLLLNTYTKLKDVSRLDAFIKSESRHRHTHLHNHTHEGEKDVDELPFDLDTAIRVCRQAGYFEHAGYLAKKYGRHEDYLRITIEDAKEYREALIYLRRLGADAAESNLARYGRAMLDSIPDETTQLLIDICTTPGPLPGADTDEELPLKSSESATKAAPDKSGSYLSYLALNLGTAPAAAPAVPGTGDNTPTAPSTKTTKAPETSTPAEPSEEPSGSSTPAPAPVPEAPPSPPPANLPSPRLYFPHFVDHLQHFTVFLEMVARKRWGQSVDGPLSNFTALPVADEQAEKNDQVAVWNTLLELYLTLPVSSSSAKGAAGPEYEHEDLSEEGFRSKAMRLLRSDVLPYDTTHALILCSSRSYTPGLVLLWEKIGMYEDVLRFWMDRALHPPTVVGGAAASYADFPPENASKEVVRYLHLYGPDHPHLYPLVLRFLTNNQTLLERHKADVRDILQVIDKESIISPLSVIQLLSRNSTTSVGLIKEWLMGRIKGAREEIDTDRQLIDSYRLETKTKLKQVEELSDPDHPKVFHVTRCSQCGAQLDLPSIHFMCDHSYHQRCLQDHETECPLCARQHGVVREIRQTNARLADQHDVFLGEVAEGGFRAVAGGFARGVLNTGRNE